jgi:hypothetical protein
MGTYNHKKKVLPMGLEPITIEEFSKFYICSIWLWGEQTPIRNDVSKHSENCESHVLEGLKIIVPIWDRSGLGDFTLTSIISRKG